MKENSFFESTTFQGDGVTILYNATAKNRSVAVGKAYRINAEGKGELVGDGEEIDGIVLQVASDNKFVGAYLFGGKNFLIGNGATVAKGDKIVGALGPSSAKGYVKGVAAVTALPTDLADLASTTDIDTDQERLTAHNAVRTAINAVSKTLAEFMAAAKGKGEVQDFDTTQALVAFK